MKLNTLDKLHRSLRDLQPEIVLPEDLRQTAERLRPVFARLAGAYDPTV